MSASGRFHCSSKEITSRTVKEFNFKYVPKIFIERDLRSLNRNKSTSKHDLNINLLKDIALVIAAHLLFVINLSLRNGIVRSNWRMAQLTPLYDKGDKIDTSDYRLTPILPTLSQLIERPLYYWLVNYLELNNLLSELQYGCRKNVLEFTTAYLIDEIRKLAYKGLVTGVLLVDLSNPFDTLGHSRLITKVQSFV